MCIFYKWFSGHLSPNFEDLRNHHRMPGDSAASSSGVSFAIRNGGGGGVGVRPKFTTGTAGPDKMFRMGQELPPISTFLNRLLPFAIQQHISHFLYSLVVSFHYCGASLLTCLCISLIFISSNVH